MTRHPSLDLVSPLNHNSGCRHVELSGYWEQASTAQELERCIRVSSMDSTWLFRLLMSQPGQTMRKPRSGDYVVHQRCRPANRQSKLGPHNLPRDPDGHLWNKPGSSTLHAFEYRWGEDHHITQYETWTGPGCKLVDCLHYRTGDVVVSSREWR